MTLHVRRLGLVDYLPTWEAMRSFTLSRTLTTPDELWLLEHPPVFTLGQAGRPEHLHQNPGIAVVRTDRGGQITYHGPGQAIVYLLLDLRRRNLKIKGLVSLIEQAVIDLLATAGLVTNRRPGAPGVYLGDEGEGDKIAALGLRVSNHCTYHGVSLNVDLDLAPFAAIDPCGYPGLAVTRTRDHGIAWNVAEAGDGLAARLAQALAAG